MNIRFLGDRKDFVKYDFLLQMALTLRPRAGVMVIPMLTGTPFRYPVGPRDADLHAHVARMTVDLAGHFHSVTASVSDFFGRNGVQLRFSPGGILAPGAREEYFTNAAVSSDAEAILFVDPDTGLETTSQGTTTHLRYTELDGLHQRMSEQSILIVYQHRRRELFQKTWSHITQALQHRTHIRQAASWTNGEVAFVLTSRSERAWNRMGVALDKYVQRTNEGEVLRWGCDAGPDNLVSPSAPRPPCACGCGHYPKGARSRFFPGHDARVRGGVVGVDEHGE